MEVGLKEVLCTLFKAVLTLQKQLNAETIKGSESLKKNKKICRNSLKAYLWLISDAFIFILRWHVSIAVPKEPALRKEPSTAVKSEECPVGLLFQTDSLVKSEECPVGFIFHTDSLVVLLLGKDFTPKQSDVQ